MAKKLFQFSIFGFKIHCTTELNRSKNVSRLVIFSDIVQVSKSSVRQWSVCVIFMLQTDSCYKIGLILLDKNVSFFNMINVQIVTENYLTNRFHFAVYLFSYRSQIMSTEMW